jgi:hypothetical protein
MSIFNQLKKQDEKLAEKKRSGKAPVRSKAAREVLPVEVVASASEVDARLEREAVAGMPSPTIKFLMKIDKGMSVALEAERARRGLRSRVETIRAILTEALKP